LTIEARIASQSRSFVNFALQHAHHHYRMSISIRRRCKPTSRNRTSTIGSIWRAYLSIPPMHMYLISR
jgi:hypothetical protein